MRGYEEVYICLRFPGKGSLPWITLASPAGKPAKAGHAGQVLGTNPRASHAKLVFYLPLSSTSNSITLYKCFSAICCQRNDNQFVTPKLISSTTNEACYYYPDFTFFFFNPVLVLNPGSYAHWAKCSTTVDYALPLPFQETENLR